MTRMLKQKDETGDLSRVTITLRDAMQETIKEIDKNARTLLDASRLLQYSGRQYKRHNGKCKDCGKSCCG